MVDLSSSREFRKLADGWYLFREGRFAEPIVLDADTAHRVYLGRKRFMTVFAGSLALFLPLPLVLHLFYPQQVLFAAFCVLLVLPPILVTCRKRLVYDLLREAPDAPEALTQAHRRDARAAGDWTQGRSRNFAVLSLVLGPVFVIGSLFAALGPEVDPAALVLGCLALGLLLAGLVLFLRSARTRARH